MSETVNPYPVKEEIRILLENSKIAKLLEIVLVFAVAFMIIFLFKKEDGEHLVYNQAVVWVANVVMLFLVWMGLRIRGESCAAFGLRWKWRGWKVAGKIFLQSLLVCIIAVVGMVLGSILMANITGVPESIDASSYDYLKDNLGMLALTLVGVYIVSSFGEEVIYRAFLINRVSQLVGAGKSGRIIAVIFSAMVFGLVHYSWGPMGVVQTAFMGLALGICYLLFKRNLWILILAHAYMDTILMVQLYLSSN